MTRNNYNYVVVTKLTGNNESAAYPSQYVTNINYFRDDSTNFPGPHSPKGDGSYASLPGSYGNSNKPRSLQGTDLALADIYGLSIFNIDRELPSTSNLVTYITKDYNSNF